MSYRQMPRWQDADKYSIDTGRQFRKSITIYGHYGTSIWPLAYIARPKWVSEADFDSFVAALEIRVAS